jgi:hypothetical protein
MTGKLAVDELVYHTCFADVLAADENSSVARGAVGVAGSKHRF